MQIRGLEKDYSHDVCPSHGISASWAILLPQVVLLF